MTKHILTEQDGTRVSVLLHESAHCHHCGFVDTTYSPCRCSRDLADQADWDAMRHDLELNLMEVAA